MRQIFSVFILFLLLCILACEGIVHKKGIVVDAVTGKPLSNVVIRFSEKTIKCDSLGKFNVSDFVGCVPDCPALEVYFEKEGYETRYINFSKEFGGVSSFNKEVAVKLIPTSLKQSPLDIPASKVIFTYSEIVLLFSFITLLFSFFLRVKYKLIWVLVILWANFSISHNVITGKFDWKFFNFVITRIYQYKWDIILIPLGAIIYWIFYFKSGKSFKFNQ